MRAEYTPPDYQEEGFHCPHCGVYAHQDWYEVSLERDDETGESAEGLSLCYCERCSNYSVWVDEKMVYPEHTTAPLPLADMPEEVVRDFMEARDVVSYSPSSASALLRRALHRLVSILSKDAENISEAIENLNKKGLDIKIQMALDSVGVTGEEAVAPGMIDPRDDEETALVLFNLLNLIVDALISQPRMVDNLLEKLPDSKKRDRDFLFRARIG